MLVTHLANVVQGLDTLGVLGHAPNTVHPVLQSLVQQAEQPLQMATACVAMCSSQALST